MKLSKKQKKFIKRHERMHADARRKEIERIARIALFNLAMSCIINKSVGDYLLTPADRIVIPVNEAKDRLGDSMPAHFADRRIE